MTLFFLISLFSLNYLPLSFVIFLLLFLFCYFKNELVKQTWVNLHFHSRCFLYLTWSFFCWALLLEVYFYLSQSHVTCGGLVELTWVDSDFFPRFFYDIFFQFYYFALSYSPWTLLFFTSLTIWLFWEQVGKIKPDWLRGFLMFFLLNFGFFTRSSFWNSFFFIPISYCGLLVCQVTLS